MRRVFRLCAGSIYCGDMYPDESKKRTEQVAEWRYEAEKWVESGR